MICNDVVISGEYSRNKPTSSHTQPCTNMFPSCKNKQDGIYTHPNKPMSPNYITCLQQRMMGISECGLDSYGMQEFFYNGVCKSQYQIPKNEGGRLVDCDSVGNGYYPDEGMIRRFMMCSNGIATVRECLPPLVFSSKYSACIMENMQR